MSLRQQIKNWYIRLTEFKWIIGIADFNPDVVFDDKMGLTIHWIKNPSQDSWFADPFILKETDTHLHILVEEYFYSNHKGRISKLIVNRKSWVLEKVIPVIDISTHLSFPAYYRANGKVYIYPESTCSGKLTLYEYDEETEEVFPVSILSDYPLADATLVDFGDQSYIMATTSPQDNGRSLDLYPTAKGPGAQAERHYTFQTRVARNAGLPFTAKGHRIRPAQDCTHHYGACVILQEIIQDNDDISFQEIRRFRSPLPFYHEAFHTFNVFENRWIAVDAEGFRYGIPAQIAHFLRESFR